LGTLRDLKTGPRRVRQGQHLQLPARRWDRVGVWLADAGADRQPGLRPATTTKMIAHYAQQGKTIDQAIGWASSELEGFMRS